MAFRPGAFTVTYSIETPWTDPPRVETTRTVVVRDVDECRQKGPCAHKCAPEAQCVNDATGAGYSCVCPRGTVGDGFGVRADVFRAFDENEKWKIPLGFVNATGCADDHPPTVSLHGAEVEHVMLRGVDALAELSHLHAEAPGKLCHRDGHEHCATATDLDYRGELAPLSLVTASAPVHLGDDNYVVAYEAKDDAGNVGRADMKVKVRRVSYRRPRGSSVYASTAATRISSAETPLGLFRGQGRGDADRPRRPGTLPRTGRGDGG